MKNLFAMALIALFSASSSFVLAADTSVATGASVGKTTSDTTSMKADAGKSQVKTTTTAKVKKTHKKAKKVSASTSNPSANVSK